ncbi:MAG: N-acetyl-gamma-glutamyl-phosphate reductase [Proteobacteria bacterium]|jgi:N-acetyl-gamma-glutamyl-phosphate reductase|nr:N-acetyl-gamma-glutamyl-phosphate reductase [Pseudomonadota bacterium]MDA1299851.1 N-acetyl-gamma-glutamyl-phosphate reductase [Pseudomonadota bacterium]
MYQIFIDGHVGTTGLEIHQRLGTRDDIELIAISDRDRKDPDAKRAAMAQADVVILCLPDPAARASAQFAGEQTRIIDASTAHRVDPDWTYGLPELSASQRADIAGACKVSNPGCWATGFIAPLAPLVRSGLLPRQTPVTVNGVSGYSGGGRELIGRYEARTQQSDGADELWHSRPYALGLTHKHLPEMTRYSGLARAPLFTPSVGHYHQGMLVSIPLHASWFDRKLTPADVHDVLAQRYGPEPFVRVHEPNDEGALDQGFLDPQGNNHTNFLDLFVFGHDQNILLISMLDNLGKGAAGAAIQNLNIMLGAPESTGLG